MAMSEFRSRLRLEDDDEDSYFVLIAPLIYYSDLVGGEIVVPEGYRTDLASIPRIFQTIIQVNGRHRRPAVIHDYLCDNKKELGMPQGFADKIFREAMKVVDVDFVESAVMYRMVRRYQMTMAFLKGQSYHGNPMTPEEEEFMRKALRGEAV
jgi:hypothetical protein